MIETYDAGDGNVALVAWLDDAFTPVPREQATQGKLIYSDGMTVFFIVDKEPTTAGGEGSGNFGHGGRPGEVGGSSSEGGKPAKKDFKVKKSSDFDYDGLWHVEFADGRKFPIYKDQSSSIGTWEVDGLPNAAGLQAFTKKELIDKLRNIDESKPYIDIQSGRSQGTIGEHLAKYRAGGGSGSGNFGHAGRPGEVGGSSSEGGSSDVRESTHRLSTGKKTSEEGLSGSANNVQKITLKDENGEETHAIFKPTSGESWTEGQMILKAFAEENDMTLDEAMTEIRDQDRHFQEISAQAEAEGVDPEEIDSDVAAFNASEYSLASVTSDAPVRDGITNRDFTFADREAASYDINEALELGSIPPTVVREIDGERGMVQEFVETDESVGLLDDGVDQDSVYALAVLDIVTGNTDRHAGNILIDTNMRAVAIDQGLTFPSNGDTDFRPDATVAMMVRNNGPMSQEMSARLARNLVNTDWDKLSSKWKMTAEERDNFDERVQRLKEAFNPENYSSPSMGIREIMYEMIEASTNADTRNKNQLLRMKQAA